MNASARTSPTLGLVGRLGVVLALLLVSLLVGSRAPLLAEGEESPFLPKVIELETSVAEHVKAKAWDDCVKDCKGAVDLHKSVATDEALVKRVLGAMELCFKSVKTDEQKKSVIEHLALTGDARIARIVKPLLKQPPAREGGILQMAAIAAASKVPHADHVEVLLDLVDNSSSMKVATASLRAFATYGQIKNKRVKILQTVVKSVEKARPGVRPSRPEDQLDAKRSEETSRWLALSPVVPDTLNGLTGQNFGTADVWFDVVRSRSDLNALFIQ